MADAKRQIEDDDNANQKRQKFESKGPTNITDVNEDCLLTIFGHLDLKSMINVGISSPFLRDAAKRAIHHKFGGMNNKNVLLISESHDTFYTDSDTIVIGGLKRCLQILRCFGDEITGFKTGSFIRTKHIPEYISKYCADHLTSFKLSTSMNVCLDAEKPLGQGFLRFSALFPELRRLGIL